MAPSRCGAVESNPDRNDVCACHMIRKYFQPTKKKSIEMKAARNNERTKAMTVNSEDENDMSHGT